MDTAQAAQPEVTVLIFEDLVDDVLGQAILSAEGGDPPVFDPAEAALRSNPKCAVCIFINGDRPVIAESIPRREALDLAFVTTLQSEPGHANPKMFATIDPQRAGLPFEVRAGKFRAKNSIADIGDAAPAGDPEAASPIEMKTVDAMRAVGWQSRMIDSLIILPIKAE